MKTYDIIYSLGTDCSCAMYLNKCHLRKCSGPFDWLTNASFEVRANLILNNFHDFLNINYIHPLAKDPTKVIDEACDYYQNINNGFYFFHDFPVGIPFEESFPNVQEKYERRIRRFYDNIASNERVLLIWTSQYVTPEASIVNFCQKISLKFRKNIDFLIIEHDSTKQKHEIQEIFLSPYITMYKMITISKNKLGVPQTLGNIRNQMTVFKKYRLYVPFKILMKRKIRKLLSQVICLFLIKRKWRKRFRLTFLKQKEE